LTARFWGRDVDISAPEIGDNKEVKAEARINGFMCMIGISGLR
jgi:hypothetical protein